MYFQIYISTSLETACYSLLFSLLEGAEVSDQCVVLNGRISLEIVCLPSLDEVLFDGPKPFVYFLLETFL